jgi:hypothetical protein
MRHVIATKILDERVGTLGTEQGKRSNKAMD